MYRHKELFWCSLIYYIVSLYSIFTAILLYLHGELSYFITFVVIFGIDKIVTLILV